ncbi:helix-turn-helix transcriptional regulator [Pseudoalteromonas aurantia]|uniref:helix-turn-helix transcriptional regulator n=1 Tax=Pseudoalteromonas aurantia TaxID=43654 RepID=UPI00201E5B03|nr:helix-turn-helix transcriptional regulator [Pseudoalteromonas aurantia]
MLNIFNNITGDDLRRMRVARRKTTVQVAKALSVTRQTYENWENDITQPKINQFIVLCTYHCIDFSSIFSQIRGANVDNNETEKETQ